MRTITIFILTLLFAVCTSAQEGSKVVKTIKGKVVHASSNRPVSYTNIGLEGTFYGTASDAEGNFELKIPEDMADKNIYFSAVGFKNKQFPVTNLFEKEFNVVKLQAQSYGVGEVDIKAQNMVLIRILRMASENIKYNYGAGPFNLHASYSNEITVNEEVQNPLIAKILVYDKTGYSQVSRADAFQSRKYQVNKEQSKDDYSFSTALMNIDDLLELDWVRSGAGVLNPGLLNDYTLSLKEQPTINGEEYWVISFSQEHPSLEASGSYYARSFKGEITINKKDYSVLGIQFELEADRENRQGRGLAIGQNNTAFYTQVKYACNVAYKDLLISTINMNKAYSFKNKAHSLVSTFTVDRAHTNNLTVLESRDYYAGE